MVDQGLIVSPGAVWRKVHSPLPLPLLLRQKTQMSSRDHVVLVLRLGLDSRLGRY